MIKGGKKDFALTREKKLKKRRAPTTRLRVEALDWSEWRGSNSRPPHPKCGALSTALHPDSY